MKYFVHDNERKGTLYHEFLKGKWDEQTFWHPESISIHDDLLVNNDFTQAILSVIPSYHYYGETEIDKEQWTKIGKQIKDPMGKEIYDEASEWLETVWSEYGCFTILGV